MKFWGNAGADEEGVVDGEGQSIWGKIWVVVGVRGHPRSSATLPFDRASMTSYSTFIKKLCIYLVPFTSYSELFVESGQF